MPAENNYLDFLVETGKIQGYRMDSNDPSIAYITPMKAVEFIKLDFRKVNNNDTTGKRRTILQ